VHTECFGKGLNLTTCTQKAVANGLEYVSLGYQGNCCAGKDDFGNYTQIADMKCLKTCDDASLNADTVSCGDIKAIAVYKVPKILLSATNGNLTNANNSTNSASNATDSKDGDHRIQPNVKSHLINDASNEQNEPIARHKNGNTLAIVGTMVGGLLVLGSVAFIVFLPSEDESDELQKRVVVSAEQQVTLLGIQRQTINDDFINIQTIHTID
jgi:hypothetical protein